MMSVDKHVIRQTMRHRRRNLPSAIVDAAGDAVWRMLRSFPPYERARAIVVYVAQENEIPTAAVLDHAVKTGRDLYIPRGSSREFVRWRTGEPLVSGTGGVLEPTGMAAPITGPGVALIPIVAWDASGGRVGRGGGFYDRVLGQLGPEIVRVGLAFAFQELPTVPRDPWDVSLHFVITERRIVRCADSRPPRSEVLGIEKGGL